MAHLPDCRNRVGVSRARALRVTLALAALVASALLADSALATSRSEKSLTTLNHQVLAAVPTASWRYGSRGLSTGRRASTRSRWVGWATSRTRRTTGQRSGSESCKYYAARNYSYWSVGENLVWRSPSLGAAGAMTLWIASPAHLANLLSKQWRQIGISAVSVAHAPGVYGGGHAVIITTDFGMRR